MEYKRTVSKKSFRIKVDLTQTTMFLTATSGDLKGEIDLSWEPVKEANAYILQKSLSVYRSLKWKHEDIVTRSSCTVSNLKSNHFYWFRVAAITSEGRTNWSIPVRKKAP